MKQYKSDFPIFKNNPKLVYLDSAATSQKPQVVLDAMVDYYENYNANVKRGIYPLAERATTKVEEVRKKVAKFINAKQSEEIIFVRNATEAINLVANTYGDLAITHNGKDIVTTSVMEHHANFVPWQFLAFAKQAHFYVMDITQDGSLQINEERLKHTKILAITHVSNMLGTINPLKTIIKKAKKLNPKIVIVVDAAQSVPHMQVDVQDLGCDFLAFSGHKAMAATGIGVLYGKKKLLEEMPPFLFGGEMIREVQVEQTTWAAIPYKFEAGTPDIAGIVSLGAAIDYMTGIGMQAIRKHEQQLIAYCLSLFSTIEGLVVYGPKESEKRGGVIAFTLDSIHPHDIAQILGDKQICIRAGHHCTMPLHKRLGLAATARASFSLYNDERDVDALIAGLKEVKKVFGKK